MYRKTTRILFFIFVTFIGLFCFCHSIKCKRSLSQSQNECYVSLIAFVHATYSWCENISLAVFFRFVMRFFQCSYSSQYTVIYFLYVPKWGQSIGMSITHQLHVCSEWSKLVRNCMKCGGNMIFEVVSLTCVSITTRIRFLTRISFKCYLKLFSELLR